MELLIKRIFACIAILLIITQSFFYSVASAVEPWTGTPWEGTPWKGTPWEGTPWEGDTWEGTPWEGKGTNGEPWTGNGTNGNGTSGNGTNGSGTSGNGTSGNGTDGNGTSGNGTNGSGTNGDGTTGNGTEGSGTDGNGTSGNGTDGSGTSGNGTSGNGTDGSDTDGNTGPSGYEIFDYIGNNVLLGQVELVADSMTDGGAGMAGSTGKYLASNVLLNGLKLGLDGPALEAVTLGIDVYDKGEMIVDAVQGARTATQASGVGATAMQGAAVAAPAMGALAKLNVATAAAGTVFGAVETYGEVFGEDGAYDTWHDPNASGADKTAEISDATASFGSTLMSAGVVTAAFPGAQAVGAGLVVAGAAIWGASKVTGYVARNWDGIKNTASKVGSKIADGWNSFTGLFG